MSFCSAVAAAYGSGIVPSFAFFVAVIAEVPVMLPAASTSCAVIVPLPPTLTPPFERIEQFAALTEPLPLTVMAVDDVLNATTHGWAEAASTSSDHDCALTGREVLLVNSLANASGSDL